MGYHDPVTRRVLLQRLVQLLGGSYLLTLPGCRRPAWRPPPKTRKPREALPTSAHLSPEEVELCAAACDAILPPDEDPGAVALGVVDYIDRRFDRLPGDPWGPTRFASGLRKVNEWSLQKEGRGFLELAQELRESTLNALRTKGDSEARDFVSQLVHFTMEGALGDPSYGGNRNRAGWTLIGFQVPCPNPSCP